MASLVALASAGSYQDRESRHFLVTGEPWFRWVGRPPMRRDTQILCVMDSLGRKSRLPVSELEFVVYAVEGVSNTG